MKSLRQNPLTAMMALSIRVVSRRAKPSAIWRGTTSVRFSPSSM